MPAHVTNRARGARGFHLADGATHVIEPGASARLDLADHPAHRAWAAAGEVAIVPVAEGGGDAAPDERRPFSPARGKGARRSRAG